ncbi:MAG: response regulator [Elusimicrobiaceae bacterium]|nr:response regulator [Elusimicrobiaceae bacterium]
MFQIGLVDDSVILRSAIRNVLESSGYEVVIEAGGSSDLFAKLEQKTPQLILLDVFFPQENGLDILARLKKQYPAIKVWMVTGLRQETIAAEAKRLGADGILYKPFDTDDLLNAIKHAQ